MMKVSIVVPILNEAPLLNEALSDLRAAIPSRSECQWEVIVVDGGSSDGSVVIARQFASHNGWIFVSAMILEPSVGRTIKAGLREVTGDTVLILPCDCNIAPECLMAMVDAVSQGKTCGAFYKEYTPTNAVLRAYQYLQNLLRLRFFRHAVWTNGIFFHRSQFDLESFPTGGFLEDIWLSDSLRKLQGWHAISHPIRVSSRRYYPNRVLRRICVNFLILLSHRMRLADPSTLRRWYLSLR